MVNNEESRFSLASGYLVCLVGDALVAPRDAAWQPLLASEIQPLLSRIEHSHYLGQFRNKPSHVAYLPEEAAPLVLDQGLELVGLRSLLGQVSDDMFQLAGRASQIINWYGHHRFCGRCGAPTRLDAAERAMVCTRCHELYYPRLSPCVIGIIERGDYCLLARRAQSRNNRYSAVAGFIEPGETAEQALEREVAEEVGLTITNIRYFTSQPWPFPSQLMLGFHADYARGDIQVDGVEIDDARWFHVHELPPAPPAGTISGQLIQDFVRRASRV